MGKCDKCKICKINESKYACPRCEILYCSVTCFQSEAHVQCSESFYYKQVQEELETHCFGSETQKKILEIIKKQSQGSESDESLDSDDEETSPNLVSRLTNINLDDDAAVWEKLTADEKHEFRKLISTGNILKIVPEWEPWWKVKKKETLIHDTEEVFYWKSLCPKVPSSITSLSNLTKVKPSDKVPFMILNVLLSYIFTVRWFKGNHLDMPVESVSTCIALSEVLRNNKVLSNLVDAFTAFECDLFKVNWVNTDCYNKNLMHEDLVNIVRGSDENDLFFSIKAAIYDLYLLCDKAKDILKNEKICYLKRFSGPPPRTGLLRLISKRMNYYLSWTALNGSSLVNILCN